jgi:hypothetical protein
MSSSGVTSPGWTAPTPKLSFLTLPAMMGSEIPLLEPPRPSPGNKIIMIVSTRKKLPLKDIYKKILL